VTKEAFCGGRAIRAGQEKIVDGGEGLEFAGAESMETMMAQRELTIAAFDTGTGALKGLDTSQGEGFEVMEPVCREGLNGGIRVAQRPEQLLNGGL
jgi:hypothetical protein